LDRYLDEFTYLFNTRKQTDGAQFAGTLGLISGKRLTYAGLIDKWTWAGATQAYMSWGLTAHRSRL
jgi:hypothetical protein